MLDSRRYQRYSTRIWRLILRSELIDNSAFTNFGAFFGYVLGFIFRSQQWSFRFYNGLSTCNHFKHTFCADLDEARKSFLFRSSLLEETLNGLTVISTSEGLLPPSELQTLSIRKPQGKLMATRSRRATCHCHRTSWTNKVAPNLTSTVDNNGATKSLFLHPLKIWTELHHCHRKTGQMSLFNIQKTTHSAEQRFCGEEKVA